MPGKNGDRRSNPSHGEDTGENEGAILSDLARSPDLARVLTEGLHLCMTLSSARNDVCHSIRAVLKY